jgi:hypothetical protein
MAKIVPGSGISDIRGAVGGSIYSRNQYGLYVRAYMPPTGDPTQKQLDVQQLVIDVAASWRALDNDQKQAWRESTLISSCSLGSKIYLKGYTLFQLLNRNKASAGETLLTAPPPDFTVPNSINNLTFDFSQDYGVPPPPKKLIVNITAPPGLTNVDYFIYAADKTTLGRTTLRGKQRLIKIFDCSLLPELDFTDEYTNYFGALQNTDIDTCKIYVIVKTMNKANGVITKGLSGMGIYGQSAVLY